MEQTDGNHKKEYNPSELPSCFMSPESPGDQHFGRMTPSFDASPSSCFLTPPCSQEKVFSSKLLSLDLQGLPKLDLELEDGDRERSVQKSVHRSPLLPEDRIIGRLIGKGRVDIISDLMAVNCHKICQRICSYLEPQDLCRFASVCSKWRTFVKQETKVQHKWRGFLEERKQHFALKGKENRGTPSHLKSTSHDDLTRLPLKTVNHNKLPESRDELDKTALGCVITELWTCSHPVSRQTLVDLRPCPKCTSPSNLPKTKEGHCLCQKCGLRFCSVCLRETEQHTRGNQCDGLVIPSATTDRRLRSQKPNKDIVGSKKCKERVRRL